MEARARWKWRSSSIPGLPAYSLPFATRTPSAKQESSWARSLGPAISTLRRMRCTGPSRNTGHGSSNELGKREAIRSGVDAIAEGRPLRGTGYSALFCYDDARAHDLARAALTCLSMRTSLDAFDRCAAQGPAQGTAAPDAAHF